MLKTLPVLGALIAASVLVVPTVSRAAEADSMRVSYADLNLTSEKGQNSLHQRIVYAAGVVCGPSDHRDVPFTQAVGECRQLTIADTQPAFAAAIATARRPSVTVLDATALIVTAH